jgi:hypothetical protein
MPLPDCGRRGLPTLPLLLLVLHALPRRLPRCAAESAMCLAVYREGGAPAVFQSAHCPRWTLPPHDGQGGGGGKSIPMGCHVAADRGRRRSQEDRAVCALGIRIPFVGTSQLYNVIWMLQSLVLKSASELDGFCELNWGFWIVVLAY